MADVRIKDAPEAVIVDNDFTGYKIAIDKEGNDSFEAYEIELFKGIFSRPVGFVDIYAGLIATIPEGWMLCDGSTVNDTDYPELYAVIGNQYGGTDGNAFLLPNMLGRVPIGARQDDPDVGSNLSYGLNQIVGTESVSLSLSNIPAHTHSYVTNNFEGGTTTGATYTTGGQDWRTATTGSAGSGTSHENRQPSRGLYYLIKVK